MKKIVGFIKDVIRFLTEDIWSKHDSEYDSAFMRKLSRHLKVFIFTAKSYGQDGIAVRSSALSLYTLMALVPLAALIFGIAKGFTFEASISTYLHEKFPNYTEFVDYILKFAEALLERTRGGIIATIGFVVLMWAAVKVFMNIEAAFNHIWKVKKSRSITRKISDYLSVMLVAPLFWFISNGASDAIGSHIAAEVDGTFLAPVVSVIAFLLPFVVFWTVFAVVYYVMPNTKVRFVPAFRAALITGTIFYLFQIVYVHFQSSLSTYNAIYGSFAAIPLFLVWMQISWQIILFGAELSFGYQNIDRYEYEQESYFVSYDYRRRATVLIMYFVAKNFSDGRPPVDSESLSRKLFMPISVVRNSLYDLEKADLVVAIGDNEKKTSRYLPAHDVSTLRVWDVVTRVESVGEDITEESNRGAMKHVDDVMREFENMVDISDKNVLLLELDNDEKERNSNR